jgi:hypothetical protein
MTDLETKLTALRDRLQALEKPLSTEEATKTALVLPFLQALGYDVFDPSMVIPEFTADVGIKKGEKVDYAIKVDGALQMLIECKTFGADLANVGASQLYRYFSVTEAKIGILTNGVEYRFYSDLDKTNKMDAKPFFVFDLTDLQNAKLVELTKFAAPQFALDTILSTATDLKYRALIEAEIIKEFDDPSDEFVELLARRVYEKKRLTATVKEWFKRLVSQAIQSTLRGMVKRRLSSALEVTSSDKPGAEPTPPTPDLNSEIETTPEEYEAFAIIRAILREDIDVARIVMRDQKSYCGILLDDNNRKPVCRLRFNAKSKWYVGIVSDKTEERFEIERLEDIFGLADRLRSCVAAYDA